MDNLARDTMLAKQAGLSYGQWKAMNLSTMPKKKAVIPDGFRPCEHCGKPFRRTNGKRFCDIECRNRAYEGKKREQMREYMRKKREREKRQGCDSVAEKERSTDIS